MFPPGDDNRQRLPASAFDISSAPGIVQRWLKTSGETVSEGETLAVMEAMKMEVPVLAARNGVLSIQIAAGESCQQDGVLGKVTP